MSLPINHIGLMGAYGTGKTTYANKLCKKLLCDAPSPTVIAVSGVARQCPLPVNKQTSSPAQMWIFATQIQKEIHARYIQSPDWLICDRTCLDSLAYAQAAGLSDVVDTCFLMALSWLDKYTHIIYFPPVSGWLHEDGFRDTDPDFQMQIHNILTEWIIVHHIPVIVRGYENRKKPAVE